MKPAQRNGVHVLAYPFPALAMAGFFLAAQSRCSATGVISSTEVNTDKRAEFRGFEVISDELEIEGPRGSTRPDHQNAAQVPSRNHPETNSDSATLSRSGRLRRCRTSGSVHRYGHRSGPRGRIARSASKSGHEVSQQTRTRLAPDLLYTVMTQAKEDLVLFHT
jgi:hypothetical protein